MHDCSDQMQGLRLPDLPQHLTRQKLIGLGEVVHGSGGLHALTARMIEELVLKHGSRTILFEAPSAAVAKIDAKLAKGHRVSAEDLSDLYFVWRSDVLLRLFNKISEINRSLSQPVRIVGFDVRQPHHEAVKIDRYAKSRGYPGLKVVLGLGQLTTEAFRAFELEIYTKKRKLSVDQKTQAFNYLSSISAEASSDANLSPHEAKELVHSSRVLTDWVNTYAELSVEGNISEGLAARDVGMFQSLDFQLSNLPADRTGPVIIWAHLGHLAFDVGKIRSTTETFASGKLMGNYIREKYGSGYSVVALMANSTSVSGPDGSQATFQALPQSLEHSASDSNKIVLITKEELERMSKVTVGLTSNFNVPLKDSYPDIEAVGGSQFDYAIVLPRADAMNEAK